MFVEMVANAPVWWAVGLLSIIALSLPVFWMFGLYNIFVTFIGFFCGKNPSRRDYREVKDTPVAIVYPTFNDFSPMHLDESRQQDHEHTYTYIVDDSTDPDIIAEIDAYAAAREGVTVIRREGREGFKAGGLNHALEHVIDEPYFALMDADEVLPDDFVSETLMLFTDSDIGFVQANHDYNRGTATRFGKALGIGVDVHWDIYQPLRNKYGFVMLLGHGALIRSDVWKEIGGFPHLVSEDLAFSTRAREFGYRGVFAPNVTCLEDFPVNYDAFRTRHKKWTGGSIEYITKELPRFLKSEEPSLVEKLDVLIPTLQLPLTAVFMAYLLAVGALELTTGTVVPVGVASPWFLTVVTIVTLLSPVYCYIIALWKRPLKLLHFVATSTTVYCSVAVLAVAHGIKILTPLEKAEFLTTPKTEGAMINWRQYWPTVAMGVVVMGIAADSGLLIGAAALTWLIAPLLAVYNRESPLGTVARVASLIPLVVMLTGIAWGTAMVLGLDPRLSLALQ